METLAYLSEKKNGEFDLPKGKERLFRMMDFDDDKEQYKVFAPPIRDKSLINGFNAILRRVEFNSGLAYGTLSDLNTVDKTAEEIKTINNDHTAQYLIFKKLCRKH